MLLANYEDVFAYDNENNAESIFEIQFGGPFADDNLWVFDDIHSEAFKATQGIAPHQHPGRGQRRSPVARTAGWFLLRICSTRTNPGDVRRPITIYQEGDLYYTTNPYEAIPYDTAWSSTDLTPAQVPGSPQCGTG